MKTIVSAGIVLGVLCAIWTFVLGFTGWYKDPERYLTFYLVIAIEIAVLIWALRKTAAEGRGYGGQVLAGVLIAFIGGLLVVGSSLLFSVVFPESIEQVAAMRETIYRQGNPPGATTDSLMVAARAGTTPVTEAVAGFVGTVVTGFVASVVIAIFVRARRGAGAAAIGS